MTAILQILPLLLGIVKALLERAERNNLMEAGAARYALERLEETRVAVVDARAALRDPGELQRVRDKYTID